MEMEKQNLCSWSQDIWDKAFHDDNDDNSVTRSSEKESETRRKSIQTTSTYSCIKEGSIWNQVTFYFY